MRFFYIRVISHEFLITNVQSVMLTQRVFNQSDSLYNIWIERKVDRGIQDLMAYEVMILYKLKKNIGIYSTLIFSNDRNRNCL